MGAAKTNPPVQQQRHSGSGALLAALLLGLSFSQIACQPHRRSDRLTVASAGRIASLDPAQASTYGTLQH